VPEEQLLDLDEIQVLGRGDGDAGRRVLVGEGVSMSGRVLRVTQAETSKFPFGALLGLNRWSPSAWLFVF
jgi:hypothetical protein